MKYAPQRAGAKPGQSVWLLLVAILGLIIGLGFVLVKWYGGWHVTFMNGMLLKPFRYLSASFMAFGPLNGLVWGVALL